MQHWSYDELGRYHHHTGRHDALDLLANDLSNPSGFIASFTAKQASLRQQLNQPIPQSLALLLADAKKKEEKKNAKRIANRMSASSSRARRKAFVQEMTELNARLKRQALILALLPDLVIVVDTTGTITFCSEQVERILMYKPESIQGSKLVDMMLPSSRSKFLNLVKRFVDADGKSVSAGSCKKRARGEKQQASEESSTEKPPSDGVALVSQPSLLPAGAISDPSFPMSVVQVGEIAAEAEEKVTSENENSDASGSRESKPSSLTRSPTAESFNNSGGSGSEDGQKPAAKEKSKSKEKSGAAKSGKLPSSDTSNTSSLSAEAKKLLKANANLDRNVRWHNKKMKTKQMIDDVAFKDDVIGDMVTANNASARLSSLRVPQRSEPSSEEDSGYRESNDSREETSSSSASDSESNGKLVFTRRGIFMSCRRFFSHHDFVPSFRSTQAFGSDMQHLSSTCRSYHSMVRGYVFRPNHGPYRRKRLRRRQGKEAQGPTNFAKCTHVREGKRSR